MLQGGMVNVGSTTLKGYIWLAFLFMSSFEGGAFTHDVYIS
jgi:hypothetical protein